MVKFSVNARVTDVTTHIVSLWPGLITWKRGIVIVNCLLRGSHTMPPSSCICYKIGLGRRSLKPNSAFCNSNTQLFASQRPQKCCERCVAVRLEKHKCTSAKVHRCSPGTEIVWNTRGGMCSGRSTGWNTGVWNESNWALSVYSLWKCVSLIQQHNTNRDRNFFKGPVFYRRCNYLRNVYCLRLVCFVCWECLRFRRLPSSHRGDTAGFGSGHFLKARWEHTVSKTR